MPGFESVESSAATDNVETGSARPTGMDGPAFREALEAANTEELAELGSPALVDALTDGTRDPESVLQAAAHSEHAARETFRAWTDDEADEGARAAFVAVAEQEDDHLRRVLAVTDDTFEPDAPGPMHAYLRGRADTVERIAGGMVARPVVSLRTHSRLVAFFEERGKSTPADLFRDLRQETAANVDDGLTLLEARCAADDWERARLVGAYVVRLAHDDLADVRDTR